MRVRLQKPLISIVIVTLDTKKLTGACLSSVTCHTTLPFEIILVNNSRSERIRELGRHAGAKIIQNPSNYGYARAANQGARVSRGRFVCFLNTDAVVSAGWDQKLVYALRRDNVGAACYYNSSRRTTREQETSILLGHCLMVPRTVIRRVGLFDERFFFGYDDLDYSLRLRLKGYRLKKLSGPLVRHAGSASIGPCGRQRLLNHSGAEFLFKWRRLAKGLDHRLISFSAKSGRLSVNFVELMRRIELSHGRQPLTPSAMRRGRAV